MAKLSERVQERQQARRTRVPLPPNNPRPAAQEVGSSAETDDSQTAQVIDLATGGGVDEAVTEPAPSDPAPAQAPTPAAVEGPASRPRQAPRNNTPVARPKGKARSTEPDVAVPLEPRQVWLDKENDLWLTDCEYANVRRGGRKVISRSSVVRLALDRLRDAMTPEQITDLLAGREPTQTARGRPRR